jgi:hypothetical protein
MEMDPDNSQQEKLSVSSPLRLRASISAFPLMETLLYFQNVRREISYKAFVNTIIPNGGLETNPYLGYPYIPTYNKNSRVDIIVLPILRFLELSYSKSDGVQNIVAESRGLVIILLEGSGMEEVYRRIGFYIVTLEEDIKWKGKGLRNIKMVPGYRADNIRATTFRARWREGLRIEEVTIV